MKIFATPGVPNYFSLLQPPVLVSILTESVSCLIPIQKLSKIITESAIGTRPSPLRYLMYTIADPDGVLTPFYHSRMPISRLYPEKYNMVEPLCSVGTNRPREVDPFTSRCYDAD